MILLHNNLACVASFTDKKESGARWAVTGVQVEDRGDGKYTVAATDTKALIVVDGQGFDSSEYPAYGALVDAPNGGARGLIPGEVFKQVMADSAKNVKQKGYIRKPILNTVAVQMSAPAGEYGSDKYDPGQAVLGWTNLNQHATPTTRLLDGRFPPYRDCIPKRPLYTVALDPDYLIRAADALKQIKGLKGDDCRLEFGFSNNEQPIVMRMHNEETNQKTTVLVMPLHTKPDDILLDGFSAGNGCNDEGFWEKEAQRLKKEYEVSTRLADQRYDLLTAKEKEIMSLRHGAKSAQENEGFAACMVAKDEQIAELEEALLQVRRELAARESDLQEYREREKHAEYGSPILQEA